MKYPPQAPQIIARPLSEVKNVQDTEYNNQEQGTAPYKSKKSRAGRYLVKKKASNLTIFGKEVKNNYWNGVGLKI